MPATSGSSGDREESATVIPVTRAGLAADGEGEAAGKATPDGEACTVGRGLGEGLGAGAGLGLTV